MWVMCFGCLCLTLREVTLVDVLVGSDGLIGFVVLQVDDDAFGVGAVELMDETGSEGIGFVEIVEILMAVHRAIGVCPDGIFLFAHFGFW